MVHPYWSAIQGVSVGERVPPRLAPVFIIPDRVPAWALERSTVELQNAPMVKYSQPAPKDKKARAAKGCSIAAPATMETAAKAMPPAPTQGRPLFTPNRPDRRSVTQPPRGHKIVMAIKGLAANRAPRSTLKFRTSTR